MDRHLLVYGVAVLLPTLLLIHTVFDLPTYFKIHNQSFQFKHANLFMFSMLAVFFLRASFRPQKLKSQLFSGQLSVIFNCAAYGDGYCT